jgi:hypothetical protein
MLNGIGMKLGSESLHQLGVNGITKVFTVYLILRLEDMVSQDSCHILLAFLVLLKLKLVGEGSNPPTSRCLVT